MSLLTSILLGAIQGVTEFLPISSSGHLAIAEHLLGMSGASEVPEFFDVLLHLGTLVAVFVAYWDDIRNMVVEFFLGIRDIKRHTFHTPLPPARRLILLIIVGTLPLFVVLPVKDLVAGLGDNMYFVACALLATGCLLFASDRVKKAAKRKRTPPCGMFCWWALARPLPPAPVSPAPAPRLPPGASWVLTGNSLCAILF